jgi:hypothetical protein
MSEPPVDPATPPEPEAPPPEPGVQPPAAPPEPPPIRAYDLPGARQVVAAGLQLALASSRDVRRASVYIGLLVLGAFGPTVVLAVLALGKILSVPGIADEFAQSPQALFSANPRLAAVILHLTLLVLLGSLLFISISIDAHAIAISLLGANAAGKPLRLWEAVERARQVFWRLLGATGLVGIVSIIVTAIVNAILNSPRSDVDVRNFVAQIIATVATTPFAFAAAGVVLGEVGAIESLRRSYRLFRARPRIALVVVLFTLVTAAIETFALGAGADVAGRIAEVFHLSIAEGGVLLLVSIAVVLAFVVALGSLLFTIGAIVAAPQVAAFLGLTFYAGGLDRARVEGTRPKQTRWVTRPMVVSMILLGLVALLGLPTVSALTVRAP